MANRGSCHGDCPCGADGLFEPGASWAGGAGRSRTREGNRTRSQHNTKTVRLVPAVAAHSVVPPARYTCAIAPRTRPARSLGGLLAKPHAVPPSTAPQHDQYRRVLLESLRRLFDSLAFVGGFDLAKSYGFWESGVDIPPNERQLRFAVVTSQCRGS
jgi:hypothetical protein